MSLVSLKDIAKECGVSVATVSKALNNHSDISEETKERVIKKASDMGYMPNSAARMLKMRKSNTIGVIFVARAVRSDGICAARRPAGRGPDIRFAAAVRGYGEHRCSASRHRSERYPAGAGL